MAIKFTPQEQEKYKEMIEIFGGEDLVDKPKIRKRILSLRKRKTNKTTHQDMIDMFGY